MTNYTLFKEVVLTRDFPEYGLKRGDVAVIVDRHSASGQETGYTLEIFNAVGETVDVVTVPESAVRLLSADDMPAVRSLDSSLYAHSYLAESPPEYKTTGS